MTSADQKTKAGGIFAPTRWSVVASAAARDSAERAPALEELCRIYWRPLYAFIRAQGYPPHDAQDLTQAFFARFLEKNYVQHADRDKGKFRSFLLASVKHFLSNERVRANALKRGGGINLLPLELETPETKYNPNLAAQLAPDKVFERNWALALLDQVLARLEKEFASAGKQRIYTNLKECLAGPRASLPYAQLADKIGASEAAVKVMVHRMRQRYRELLREEIWKTVATREEVEQELLYLFSVLGNG